jgi:hypothetical protein
MAALLAVETLLAAGLTVLPGSEQKHKQIHLVRAWPLVLAGALV